MRVVWLAGAVTVVPHPGHGVPNAGPGHGIMFSPAKIERMRSRIRGCG